MGKSKQLAEQREVVIMFLSSWMTYQRRREREKIAAAKIEAKYAEARRKLEEEENEITDEEDIEENEEEKENKEEKNVPVDNLFYDVCKCKDANELEKKK